jgi:glycosyltransferase involved in cell wall biosynthesis
MIKSILVLNYEFPPLGGWAAPVSCDISKWYVDAWYNVDVITMWFKDLPKYENKDWINIYRVKCIRTKKEVCHPREQLTYLISWYFKSKELLKLNKYDICHCHFLIPTWILALFLKWKFWLKYFVTSHWSDVPWYNPYRFTFLHKFTPKLLKKIINNSEFVISPSKYLADLIKKNVKWIDKNIEIIPNWIDTHKFIPLKKEKIILWSWRLWPSKWLHLLAEAFSEIEDTKWFELHICGDWPLMSKIKSIKASSKNKIVLHWWMDNNSEEYINLLWKTMIYCLPSVSENWPISILEWMASWCAIVTTNLGWCGEMVKDTWFFIQPNVGSIKNWLLYLINHDCEVEKLGKNSRYRAVNSYDKNNISQEWKALLKK